MGQDINKSSSMDIDEIIDLICLRAGVKYSDTRKAIALINDKCAISSNTELAKRIIYHFL